MLITIAGLARDLAHRPDLVAHLSGPLARKVERLAGRPLNRKNRVKWNKCMRALAKVRRSSEKPIRVDFSIPWTLELAKVAFRQWEESGENKTKFAMQRGFDVRRFRRWEARVRP